MSNPSENPQFGKYTVLRRIGTGGMAEIFKCRLQGLGGFDKNVVVKRILPDLLDDAEFVRMFLDEARVSANLQHPNIVQIYEIDQINNVPYIAMEYVRGPTLGRLLKEAEKQNKPNPAIIAKIISDICGALHYAHNAVDSDGQPIGIIHRDVSPQNIIVSTEGISKLLDFGVAKARGRLQKTNAGTVKGKLRYMSPEQFKGKNAQIDHRVDVFSVGVCLYQALTGHLPYSGDSEIDVMRAAAMGDYLRPSQIKADVDPELERIVLWAMAPDVNERCESALVLQEALEVYTNNCDPRVTTASAARYIRELFGDVELQEPKGETSSSSRFSSVSTRSPSSSRTSLSSDRPGSSSRSVDLDASGRRGGRQSKAVWVGAAAAAALVLATPLAFIRGGGEQAPEPEVALAPEVQPVPPAPEPADMAPEPSPAAVDAAEAKTFIDEADKLAREGRYKIARELLQKARRAALEPALEIRIARLSDVIERDASLAEAESAIQARDYTLAKERAKAALLLDTQNERAQKLLSTLSQLEGARTPAPQRGKKQQYGTLTVVAERGATIFVDDLPVGTAPLYRKAVATGSHGVEVRLRGFVSQSKVMKVSSGREAQWFPKLVAHAPEPAASTWASVSEPTPAPAAVVVAATNASAVATDAAPAPSGAESPAAAQATGAGAAADSATPAAPAPVPTESAAQVAETPAAAEEKAATVAGSGGSAEVEAEAPAAPVPAPSGDAEPEAPAAPEVAEEMAGGCPEGAQLAGAPPPGGDAQWCELPGGVRHGKFIRWWPNGQRAEIGEFRQGKKNGRWVEYYENGSERDRTEWRRGVKSW